MSPPPLRADAVLLVAEQLELTPTKVVEIVDYFEAHGIPAGAWEMAADSIVAESEREDELC